MSTGQNSSSYSPFAKAATPWLERGDDVRRRIGGPLPGRCGPRRKNPL